MEPSPATEAPTPTFTVDEAPIDAQEAFEDRPENLIVVRHRLSSHPAVQATAAYLNEQRGAPLSRARTFGDGTLDIVVSLKSVRRALLWMDAFVRACEVRGFEIIGKRGYERTSHVRVLGQDILFKLFEPERRIDILKETGKRLPPKSIFFTRYRYEGTGVLEFRMGHQYGSERGTWRDHKDAPLEDQLNDIMVGLVEAAAIMNFHDERRRREEEEQERLAQIAHQARQQREAEKQRVTQLLADAEAWRKAQNLRAYADAVEAVLMARDSAKGAVPTEAAAWLEWARYIVADGMDPLTLAAPTRGVSLVVTEPRPMV